MRIHWIASPIPGRSPKSTSEVKRSTARQCGPSGGRSGRESDTPKHVGGFMKACMTIAFLCGALAWAADLPSAQNIRGAAAKGLGLIQKSQKDWYSKQSCTSCHQQVLPALAFRIARLHGVPLDEPLAHADAVRAFGIYADLDRAVQWTHIIDPPSDGYALVAADAAGVRPNLTTAVYARLLAARQESDGHWEPVDVRPPQHYSPFTDTAVAARAIQLYGHSSQKADTAARLASAR